MFAGGEHGRGEEQRGHTDPAPHEPGGGSGGAGGAQQSRGALGLGEELLPHVE